jgi:hypothetical protein
MKRIVFAAALCMSTVLVAGITRSDDTKATVMPAKTVEKTAPVTVPQQEKSLIKPEVDKTDILAIPFDSSEVEERQEEATLEKLQKYEQAKHEAKQEADLSPIVK